MADHNYRTIRRAESLAALANPFRSRLLDALRVDGPSTATALAQRTGQAVGSASHHLRVLAETGFIEEAPDLARDRRERWWRLSNSGFRWNRADLDGSAVEVARQAEALQAERQADRVREWLANSETAGEWNGTAFASQDWLRLTPQELDQLGAELLQVLTSWHERVADEQSERLADPNAEPVLVFMRGFPSQP
ncbi:DNA-binding transcriptional ArsR family regulator [Naumannella cuiyingiana]|uniref:DNA-binding transcriptional ArsR family regulator n=1 Tax=Naumannella cuiyingiana TaxID=1347891 RepID=A0A7Z0ILH7_9ACTN|nr:winged helix-turn-helix domain-containing protein [Naumannella cuiyingiana]NYI71613.1 DNA-binding transcriptional ArsR family regulator [Naumannella cuiyingiana]